MLTALRQFLFEFLANIRNEILACLVRLSQLLLEALHYIHEPLVVVTVEAFALPSEVLSIAGEFLQLATHIGFEPLGLSGDVLVGV